MVRVSVIVPVYNVEQYLARCIDSLLNQDFKDLEIILVNDCSPDHSDEIMKAYEKKNGDRIKCIYLKENIRQGGARNKGLMEAQGEYVVFVDSDDWVDENYVSRMYDEAEKTNSDIIYTDYIAVNKEKKVKKSIIYPALCGKQDDARKKINLLFVGRFSWGCMIKKSLLLNNGLLFPEKMLYEDVAVCPLFAYYADVIGYVKDTCYYYFQREDSVVHDIDAEYQKDEAQAVLMLYEECVKRGIRERYPTETEAMFIKYFYAWGMNTSYQKFSKPPKDYMEFLAKKANGLFPNYRQNPYLLKNIDMKFINQMFQNDAEFGFAEMPERDLSYLDYYGNQSVRQQLSALMKYLKKDLTVLWGAGKMGREFLFSLGKEASGIRVADKNIELAGTALETGHTVMTPEEALKGADAVLITNNSYYAEIRDEVKEKSPNVKVINVYAYLLMAEEFQADAFIE